ncbi:MAG: hypothetical protein BGO57_12405 [Sphingomonadales bacterium 63-6]|nr:MAG: hypothetical protein BGO57_12405 [Sphingomonadales bacterium 63-6]
MMPARAQPPQTPPATVQRIHMGKAPAVSCPVCGQKAHTRSSTEITPTYRELYYRCSNIACGMTWVASLSFERVLSPSGLGDQFRAPRPAQQRPPGEDFGQMSIFEMIPKPSG